MEKKELIGSLKPIESKLKYKDQLVKKARMFLDSNLKSNSKTVKDFQKKIWELLENKWYEKIKVDWKIWWQTLEAIRLFLNEYEWKNIKKAEDVKVVDVVNSTVDVYAEFKKLEKAEKAKQKEKFEKAKKNASKKDIKEYNGSMEKLGKQKSKEIENTVIKPTKKQLDEHYKKVKETVLNSELFEEYSVPNGKWDKIPVSIPKSMDNDFKIDSEENKLSFKWEKDDLPVDFDLDIKAKEKEERNDNDIIGNNPKYIYNMDFKLNKEKWVNYFTDISDNTSKNLNQVYYSYTKDWKHYIWVLWFNFDTDTWEVKNYKHIDKKVDHQFTKQELEKYQDAMYDSGLFDSWKSIENDTIITYNNVDVATEEKTYEKLLKTYKDKNALDTALKLLWADILSDDNLKNQFNIWVFDKQWLGSWDILWALITEEGLENAKLLGKLENYYSLVKNGYISPYEVKIMQKNMSKYPDVKALTWENKLQFLSDYDASGKIWDQTKMPSWGEKAIYNTMEKLIKNNKWNILNKKIEEIEEIWWKPEGLKSPYLEKIFFWRGINFLPVSSLELKQYLSWHKSLWEIKTETIKREKKAKKEVLDDIFKEHPELKEKFKIEKVKAVDRLIKQLPDNLKNNQNIISKIKDSVGYVWANLVYVSDEWKANSWWASLNFKIKDLKIFDSLSLWFADIKWTIIPWISLSKSFNYKSEDSKTEASITWTLVNGIIPVLSWSANYDFSSGNVENWTESSKKVLTSVWTAFPVMFESLGYNFGKAGNMEKRDKKMSKTLDKMLFKDLKNWQVDVSKYSWFDVKIASSINLMLKKMPMKGWSPEYKKEVLNEMKMSILNNYKNLNINSNEWTHLSEVWLIRAIIPLPYVKWESIKSIYKLDKNAPKDIFEQFEYWKFKEENITDVKSLVKYFEKIKWVSFDSNHNYIVIDPKNLENWTIIWIDPKLDIKKDKDWKILIGWNLRSIKVPSMLRAWEHINTIVFGDALWQTISGVWMDNFIWRKSNGKITENINTIDKLKPITLGWKSQDIYIKEKKQFKEKKENFKKSDLYKNLTEGINWSIFLDKDKQISGQYKDLVSLVREYKYDNALDYIRDTMLKKNFQLSKFIYHRIWQEKLNNIRKDLDKIKAWKDVIIKKIVVETIINQFFIDVNTLQKRWVNIWDKKTQKYMRKLSMKQFDSSDLDNNLAYNRTAGFARTLRDEVFWKKHSTFEGHLMIKWKEDLKQVLTDTQNFKQNNELPEWANNLSKGQKDKLWAFYIYMLANNKYINDGNFDKPTYKTAEAEDIIAFPFTYKLNVKWEEGHVPIAWMVELVDRNWDWNIDENDYEKIDETIQIREYMFSMLSEKLKEKLKQAIWKVYNIELGNDELRQLFINKKLNKNWQDIEIDYKVALAKWWPCFNTALILKDLKIKGMPAWISVSNGNIYLKQTVDSDVDYYTWAGGKANLWDNVKDNNAWAGGNNSGWSNQGDPWNSTIDVWNVNNPNQANSILP